LFHTLIRNTAVSAFAYLVISALGIWITGALASTYGLAAFGTITLARLFTASGLVGVFDLGTSENASHVIARARATGDWDDAIRSVQWLLLFAFISALLCALAILLLSQQLGPWLGLDEGKEALFERALVISAIALPLCVTALVAEGIIRGFERYAAVRGLEVATSAAYAVGCFALIRLQQSFFLVIYLYIGLMVLRALAAILIAWKALGKNAAGLFNRPSRDTRRAMFERTWLVAPNKVLATLQTQSIPLVIGLMIGATGAAIYDLLMRLPRFAKSALGLLNSAVLPFASRLEAANSKQALRSLNEHGLVMIAFLTAPPLFAIAAFSKQLLHLWVDDSLARYWMWQSFAFSTPLVTVIIGFAAMTMFGTAKILKTMNLMIVIRLVIQYAIALLLISQLGERAFILGSTAAVLATAFWELRMLLRQQGVDVSVKRRLLKLLALCAGISAGALPVTSFTTTLPLLLLGLALLTALSWLLIWIVVIPEDFRTRLLANLRQSFLHWQK
jgi:O-antigen/teichoic acid export membrane protein